MPKARKNAFGDVYCHSGACWIHDLWTSSTTDLRLNSCACLSCKLD